MEYRVELEVFHGPLDLLLYLIKRDELDIYDIPIARITETYLQYVRELKDMSRQHGLDINVTGDFLVMAATLMEIKSAMLLPRQEIEASENSAASAMDQLADPRAGLVRQLLEYKKLRDQAALLERHRHLYENRFPRVPVLPEVDRDEPPPLDLDEVQIWDLLSAFSKLMSELGIRKPRLHEVAYDDTPIELHAADIEDRLKRESRLSMRKLLEGRASRSEMIGVFLALLELIREKKILVRQDDLHDDIEIEDAPPEHRKTFAGATIHVEASVPVDAEAAADEKPAPVDTATAAEQQTPPT